MRVPRPADPGWPARAAVLAGAAAVRIWLLTTDALRLDADEAATAIMARRILDGHHRAYFAGQDYMGTAEQYLQAAALWLLPDGDITVRLPQVGLSVLACFLVHRVALRCGLSARRALLAAALFAAGPYFPAYWGAKARGAYASALVLGLAGVLVALWVEPEDPRRAAKVALFGAIAGAGLWANLQVAYLLVPAGWWLLATVRRRWLSSAMAGAAGFVVGAAPSLWHTLAGGPSPFSGVEGGDSSVAERADHFVAETLPDLLGVRDDGDALYTWLPPAFVVLVAVAGLGIAVGHRRRGLLDVASLRTAERSGVDLLLAVLLLLPLLYVQTGTGTTATGRYVFVVYGVLPVLAAALPAPRAWIRTRADVLGVGALAVALVGLHTFAGSQRLIAQDDGGHEVTTGQVVVNEDLGQVVDVLVARGERTAYADYWLALPLTWEADGDVLVEALSTRRFPHVSAAVDRDPSPALVVALQEVRAVSDALTRRGASFELDVAAGWGVFTGVDPGVHLGPALTVADALGGS